MINANGTVYITNDLNMAIFESDKPNSKIIYIDDEVIPELQSKPNVINAAIFIPPYDLIYNYYEGNTEQAYKGYEIHLNKYFVKPAISMLAEILLTGTNFLIYVPSQIYDLASYIGVYMRNHYGIICGSINIPYTYDINFHNDNLGLLYLNNYIGCCDYLRESNLGSQDYNMAIFKKLLMDINPVLKDYTSDDYSKYFLEIQSILKNSDKKLRPALVSI